MTNQPPTRDFPAFLDECLQDLQRIQQAFNETWGIDACERWEVDQSQGTIAFFNTRKGHAKLVGKLQILGTFDRLENTWLWSWANPSVSAALSKDALELHEYGKKNLRMRLTEKSWKGEPLDAWKMTALAIKLLGADAAYRGPAGPQDVFMVLRDLGPASETRSSP